MDYTIGQVSKLLGLSIEGIRKYEKMGIIMPVRSACDYRKYGYLDITALIRAKAYSDSSPQPAVPFRHCFLHVRNGVIVQPALHIAFHFCHDLSDISSAIPLREFAQFVLGFLQRLLVDPDALEDQTMKFLTGENTVDISIVNAMMPKYKEKMETA